VSDGAAELVSQILKEAEDAAEATLARASRAAEREIEAARQDLAAAGERERGSESVRTQAEKRRLIGTARTEARRLIERRRHDLVEEVFSDVQARLPAVRAGGSYTTALLELCGHTLAQLPGGSLVLEVDAEDWQRLPSEFVETFNARFNRDATVEVRAGREEWGGGVVGLGRNVEVDNRLPKRLERLRSELAAEIARSMFGD
jgi:vacuolar-type H+-ATPase subunit E/Vma4